VNRISQQDRNMKNEILFVCFVTILLIVGCQEKGAPVIVTPLPTQTVTLAQPLFSPSASTAQTETVVPVATETVTPSNTPDIPAVDGLMQIHCIEVSPIQPDIMASNGIVVLESRVIEEGRYKPDVYLLDMATGNIAISEPEGGYAVSPDKKLMAYISSIIDEQDRIVSQDLVIADANGQRQKTINWQDEWGTILFWHDEEHLVLYLSEIEGRKVNVLLEPAPILVLNIVTGEQQILLPSFSGFLSNKGVLPYWNGQSGVAYDPTLTRAIYLRSLKAEEYTYTYAIWDLENDRLVTTLEDILTTYFFDIIVSPMPFWSPDGSHFVVVGRVFDEETDEYVEMELYRVSRDGEAEKLTALNPLLVVEDLNLSWSPGERYIVMFLNKYYGGGSKVRLGILDTETLVMTDTCMDVYSDVPPIWSPDGSQFLVWDHRNERVILVAIDQGQAAIIAEGMEPVGWLVNE
jgi:hypothetical protein